MERPNGAQVFARLPRQVRDRSELGARGRVDGVWRRFFSERNVRSKRRHERGGIDGIFYARHDERGWHYALCDVASVQVVRYLQFDRPFARALLVGRLLLGVEERSSFATRQQEAPRVPRAQDHALLLHRLLIHDDAPLRRCHPHVQAHLALVEPFQERSRENLPNRGLQEEERADVRTFGDFDYLLPSAIG